MITGASGFIGSAVTRAVLATGAHVVGGDRAGRRRPEPGWPGCRAGHRRHPRPGRDAVGLRGRALCLPPGGDLPALGPDPRIFNDVNVGGTLNVIDAVRAAGCERMVYTSTVGVLGLHGTRHGQPADESALCRPRPSVRVLQADQVRGRARGAARRGRGPGRQPGAADVPARARRSGPDPDRQVRAGLPQRQDARVRRHRHERLPRRRPGARPHRRAGARPEGPQLHPRRREHDDAGDPAGAGRLLGPAACRGSRYRAAWSSRPASSRT